MTTMKIIKKHHKHLNNPFPSKQTSLPFVNGTLFFNLKALPSHQIYPIGTDFELLWSSNNGGYISIHHKSQPTRSIWSTVPGTAFVSAALVETDVEESRGSFVVKDRYVHLVCNHQSIQDIRIINRFDSDYSKFEDSKGTQFPSLLIKGWIFTTKNKETVRSSQMFDFDENIQSANKGPSNFSSYWVLFDQKNSGQIGFSVKLGQPNVRLLSRASPLSTLGLRKYRSFRRRVLQGFIKRRVGICWSITKRTSSVIKEEIEELKVVKFEDFNRVYLTFKSEGNERFYGFGEQFSQMDFKGKRVPIFVQEQGIGRGDQPITFAANLISYR